VSAILVDDDADTCRNLVDLLSEFGCRVDAAECGDVAPERARRQPYDVGLLDLRMPGMDWLPVAARSRHRVRPVQALLAPRL
jgi:CheY-like chemotaxis protein